VGNVARTKEKYLHFFVDKSEGKRSLGRSNHIWYEPILKNLKEIV